MTNEIVTARVELDEYTNKVLGVIKARYGLKDKSEAINKFAEIYGEEFAEKDASDEYVKKVIELSDEYFRKHKNKKMSFEELDSLIE